jgi:hypothetical protein
VPARDLKTARGVADAAGAALQEARTLMEQEDYAAVEQRLEGQTDAIREQIGAIDAMLKSAAAPPARRGR